MGPEVHLRPDVVPKIKKKRRLLLRRRASSEDEIDFTAMIDVTFLLLIYFCVTEVHDAGAKVKLPMATNGAPVSELQAVVFTLDRPDSGPAPVYLGGMVDAREALSDNPDKLAEQIATAVEEGVSEGKTDVLIQADRGVLFRDVNQLIKYASHADVKQLHLGVLEE